MVLSLKVLEKMVLSGSERHGDGPQVSMGFCDLYAGQLPCAGFNSIDICGDAATHILLRLFHDVRKRFR